MSPTEKYPIASYDYDGNDGTHYYGGEEDITWNVPNSDTSKPNYIASIYGNGNAITFMFKFEYRVNFDVTKSLAYASGAGTSAAGAHFFEYYGEDEEYVYYSVCVDAFSDYGATIDIEYVKLVFSC